MPLVPSVSTWMSQASWPFSLYLNVTGFSMCEEKLWHTLLFCLVSLQFVPECHRPLIPSVCTWMSQASYPFSLYLNAIGLLTATDDFLISNFYYNYKLSWGSVSLDFHYCIFILHSILLFLLWFNGCCYCKHKFKSEGNKQNTVIIEHLFVFILNDTLITCHSLHSNISKEWLQHFQWQEHSN